MQDKKLLYGSVQAELDVHAQEILLHFSQVLHSFKWASTKGKEIISSSVWDKDDYDAKCKISYFMYAFCLMGFLCKGEELVKMPQWLWERINSPVPDEEFLCHERNWITQFCTLNWGSSPGKKFCSVPSNQQCLKQHLLHSAVTHSHRTAAAASCVLKAFIFWHNHLSASVFVSTWTLSLLTCKIFFPKDVPASSVLLWAVWLMEVWGRNALPK